MKDLIIFGAGGFGREVAWLVERINAQSPAWTLLGFLDDDPAMQGRTVNGCPVLGGAEAAADYPEAFFVCTAGASAVREKIVTRLRSLSPGIRFATLIDPGAELSSLVKVGEGSIICAHSILTVNIDVGCHVIINLDCTVGHDAVLEDLVTLYPSVNVSGAVRVGRRTELGTGAQIIQGKRLGENVIVGAGAVVVSDIPADCTAVGCPARPIRFRE